jgi:hypothetical protein
MTSLEDLKLSYEEFFRSPRYNYADRINTAIDDYAESQSKTKVTGGAGTGCPRVKVKLSELRSVNAVLERRLINDPLRHLRALELAAHDIGKDDRPGYDSKNGKAKKRLYIIF